MNDLTPREWQVLRLVADGLTNREIANKFVLSVRTVESHRDNACQKLHIKTRAEITAWVRGQLKSIAAEKELDKEASLPIEVENIIAVVTVPPDWLSNFNGDVV